MESKRTIILTCGSGFLGSRLLKLISSKYKVILITNKTEIKKLSNDCSTINIDDVNNIHNAEIIIHCAGLINGNKKECYESNVDFTSKLINFANKKGIYFIFISSLNVKLKKKNHYAMTKYICEQNIINALNKYTIIRPSYLFDDEYEPNLQFIFRFMKYLKYSPILISFKYSPILQPLYVFDLISFILGVLNNDKKYLNKFIEIAGPIKLSMSSLINAYITSFNGPHRIIDIPNIIEKIIVIIFRDIFRFNYEDRTLNEINKSNKYVIACKRSQKFI